MSKNNECIHKSSCKQKDSNLCGDFCLKQKILRNLLSDTNLPEYMWKPLDLIANKDYSTFEQLSSIKTNIKKFVSEGNNLLIYSQNCGNGKTSWAAKLLVGYVEAVWYKDCVDRRALFVNVPKFLYDCKRNISHHVDGFDELCEDLNQVDLVVWDDIGAGNMSGYEHQILLQSIDYRLNNNLCNIFTANITEDEIYSTLGNRLGSRVWGCSKRIKFVDPDKRGLDQW